VGPRILIALHGLLVVALLAERRRRRRAQRTLDVRLRFERLLAELTTTFARLRPWEVGPQIEQALGTALDVLGVDRAALAEFTADDRFVRFTYRRRRPGIRRRSRGLRRGSGRQARRHGLRPGTGRRVREPADRRRPSDR
jgi:hypothetical protein